MREFRIIRRKMREAARSLTPVVVKRGADGVRCEGTVEDLEGRGSKSRLIITPIHARSVAGSGPVIVHATSGEWTITADDAEVLDERVLAIPLFTSLYREGSQKRDRHHAKQRLSVSIHPGIGDECVLPLVDIGASACGLQSRSPVAPGTRFESVDILGAEGVLRHARASAVDCVPWMSATGDESFRIRLGFVAPLERTLGHEVESGASRIRQLLEACAAGGMSGSLDDRGRGRVRFCAVHRSQIELECEVAQVPRAFAKLQFELFGVQYESRVRLVKQVGARVFVTIPVVLRRSRRRRDTRFTAANTEIDYWNPITSQRGHGKIRDVSAGGLSFEPADTSDVLWHGVTLSDAVMRFPSAAPIELGDMLVRSRDDLCRVSITPSGPAAEQYRDALMSLRRPELAIDDGSDFDGLLELYRDTGLVMPYMEEQLFANAKRVRENWRSAHSQQAIARTFSRREDTKAVAGVSALRAWEGSWLAQHMSARKRRLGCSPGDLFSAFLEYVVPRPDCRHLVFFTTAHNAKMNDLNQRFQDLSGTPEAVAKVPLSVWLLHPRSRSSTLDLPDAPDDRRLISRAARRDFGEVATEALGFTADSLNLGSLGETYAAQGLERRRELRRVDVAGVPRVASVTERTSLGLSVPGLMNATWLLPLRTDRTEEGRRDTRQALHTAITSLRLRSDEPSRLLLAHAGTDRTPFVDAGAAPVCDAYVYVMNHAGLRRYEEYMSESYGATREDRRKVKATG